MLCLHSKNLQAISSHFDIVRHCNCRSEIIIARRDCDRKLSHRLQIRATRQSLRLVLKITHQKPRHCLICVTLVEIMYDHYANIPIVSTNLLCNPE
ncbi:hypothetical protein BDZ94DRAFT_1276507 [Collybia nuda]|uniref:Uncharacterized protein n=1 Tax=Collybia nuda TaxID=64659 RepID=A0A9P6C8D8_9AGAR|nr:hypothetical protein BDZ94DRAFT_1276507 [Collybia nuda]